jgi:hypothetical protein
MLRRAFIAVAPALLLAGPARAAEEKKASNDVGQYVDLSPVALPVVVRGTLVNYVFVYVRIQLTTQANAGKWRSKEPYFRDALVRAGHRTPFTRNDSYVALDVAKMKAVMLREARAITGPNDVAAITIVSQAPKRTVGLPKPPVAAAPRP